jgi:hypothetical protein
MTDNPYSTPQPELTQEELDILKLLIIPDARLEVRWKPDFVYDPIWIIANDFGHGGFNFRAYITLKKRKYIAQTIIMDANNRHLGIEEFVLTHRGAVLLNGGAE